MNLIVSDSSSIIILASLNRLDLLSGIFTKVYIPPSVYNEITIKNDRVKLNFIQSGLFEKRTISKNDKLTFLLTMLHKGEAEAIALALENDLPLLIDEKKGRNIASKIGVKIIGFIGILILNYKTGIITKTEAIEIFNKAKSTGFRISKNIESRFLSGLV
jgi:uncharacterized protein